MILLAFFLPVAVYLLVLGITNRARTPLLVPGPWDFAGVLLAASGFLLLGGPAIMTSLHDRWRVFWLIGPTGMEGGAPWEIWFALSVLYFAMVVGGAVYLVRSHKSVTAVYNVAPGVLERALQRVLDRLGLQPLRTGNVYVFGVNLGGGPPTRPSPTEALQAPHYLPPSVRARPADAVQTVEAAEAALLADELGGQTAVLEVEAFPLMRHASLKWSPPTSTLRREVERELGGVLSATETPEHPLGLWLMVGGFLLFSFSFVGAVLLMLFQRPAG